MPQTKKVKGYVYVLTNPSFREDWVKIGKSSREVDTRSKELDNTAVPLPFEIYATIQSSKYEYIEQHMHDVFGKYAGKRIRKGREFFNVRPEVVYEEFLTLAKIVGDAKVLGPDFYKKVASIICPRPPKPVGGISSSKIYHFKHKRVANAKLIVRNGLFIIKKGSTLYPEITHDKNGGIKKLREQRKEYIVNNKTTKDISFPSPSSAGAFLYGTASNGQKNWVDDEGNTLGDNIKNGI